MKKLSAQELINLQEKYNATLIDIRPIAAYNGWPLQNEPRGGHIPGAKSIPLEWTIYMDWVEVLEEKNITKEQIIILYGYSEVETQSMADKLLELGFDEVFVYNKFVEEWSVYEQFPLEYLPRFKNLVYPDWVKQLVDGKTPRFYDNNDFVICHSHYDYIEDYHKGHIPGAIPIDTNSLESTETWNRRSPQELRKTLEGLGIRYDTTVVIYGRFSSPVFNEEKFPGKSAGHLGAIRCAAIMLYAGVKDIRILNGGLTTWEISGYPLSTEPNKPKPVNNFGIKIPAHPEFMIDTPKARKLLAANDGELVSIRSWEEFIGNNSGYHYIDKKGRIPGAIFGNCGSDAYHMENFRNFDHTMREYPEVHQTWFNGDITPDKHIAFYCGTGWRGSEAFMNAYLMDWPNICIYDGGWHEWCSDPENPIETGPPK